MSNRLRACVCCGGRESEPLDLEVDGWRLVQCVSCSFVFMPRVPDASALQTTLEWSQSFKAEAARRRRRSPLLDRLDTATRLRTRLLGRKNPMSFVRREIASGRILDLGCGNGSYLAGSAPGFELYGIEISPPLARQAHEVFAASGGRAVEATCIEGLARFEDGFFDAAILRSYLEHEPLADAVLESLFHKLKPGSVAVVKVPNYACLNRRVTGRRWCGYRFPDHVNHFTPATLERLAKRCGFTFACRLVDRLPTDDNFWAVLRRPAAAGGSAG